MATADSDCDCNRDMPHTCGRTFPGIVSGHPPDDKVAQLKKALHDNAILRGRLDKERQEHAATVDRLRDLSESFDRDDGSLEHDFEIDNALERARTYLDALDER